MMVSDLVQYSGGIGGGVMADISLMDDSEVGMAGTDALNTALGPAGALRFPTLVHLKPTDYAHISRGLYAAFADPV